MIMQSTQLPILIVPGERTAGLLDGGERVVRLDRDRDTITAHSGAGLGVEIVPSQLAYVRHTSGSTGMPKGVQISHEAFANFLRAMRDVPGMSPDDSLVAVTTLSFDIAELEVWLPLTTGARVTVASRSEASDPLALARLLEQASATMLQATPVTWRMLAASGWPGSAELTALVGGEALPPEIAVGLPTRVRRVWNMYGPTETTIWSTCTVVEPGAQPVSAGRPIANTCVHVLDAGLHPVAAGMVGELCIGGLGVARGYSGRPGLTAERFVPDPFGCWPGGRMYRTGDLARYDPHGRLYVLGRADSQVKIRGFRVELGAVETALARHPSVRAAVAVTVREPSGELRLDAHVVLAADASVSMAELRGFLKDTLPPAMVPSRIGVLSSLPLTANGKVDRAALPQIRLDTAAPGGRVVPAAPGLERTIAGIWGTVFGIGEPSVTENFFDLGGHSVLLVEAASQLTGALGREVTPLTILEYPTIASLARHLGLNRTAADAAGEAGDGPAQTTGRARLLQRRSRVEA